MSSRDSSTPSKSITDYCYYRVIIIQEVYVYIQFFNVKIFYVTVLIKSELIKVPLEEKIKIGTFSICTIYYLHVVFRCRPYI